jgi:hypothetical protein
MVFSTDDTVVWSIQLLRAFTEKQTTELRITGNASVLPERTLKYVSVAIKCVQIL